MTSNNDLMRISNINIVLQYIYSKTSASFVSCHLGENMLALIKTEQD